MVTTALNPAPGWYKDPASPRNLRYWNGYAWTVHTAAPVRVEPWAAPPGRPAELAARNPGLPGIPIAVLGFAAGVGASFACSWLLLHAGSPGGLAARLGISELFLWAGMLAPVFYVSRKRGTGRLSTDFGFRFKPIDIGIGFLGACAGRSAVLLAAIFLLPVYQQLQHQPQVGIRPTEITGATWVVFGILVCVGAPLVEELFFRGLVQTRLVGLIGAGKGVAVTSLVFGAAHLIGWQDAASLIAALILAAGGGVLGFLRYRTGRLGTSMMAHAFFNAMAFAILLATNT
jgi:membrane protease YdiL (CAAX protease family)